MGKYSGKILTVYIAPSGVRVCDGENKNGNPDISKFFIVGGVSEYFAPIAEGQAQEIVNMSGLISAIVSECKAQRVSTRRVMVCSDCFGIDTEVRFSSGGGSIRGALTGDIKNIKLFGSKQDKIPQMPGQMLCKQNWGDITLDGSVQRATTVSRGDKYMLSSLVKEFYTHGYEVIFVSGAKEVLLNLRSTEEAKFDSRGKIIIDYDVECHVSTLLYDTPVELSALSMVDRDEILSRLRSQLTQAQLRTGRNPKIYLAGTVFHDTKLYSEVAAALEADGYFVYDVVGRPDLPEDYEEQVRTGARKPVITPDYTANIAMLLCGFSKTVISLTPQVELEDMFKKNSKAVATIGCGVAAGVFALSAVLAGLRGYDLWKIKAEPSQLANLQSQVSTLTSKQASLNATIATLTQADTTILELMKFIDTNQSPRLRVVSVDTRDMLADEMSVDTTQVTVTTPTTDATSEPPTTVTGSTDLAPGVGRESIVIRGYAKTGNEAVSYFNRLFNYGLPVDPVLNGVERYTLPGGEEVYVFEIEIGGDGL